MSADDWRQEYHLTPRGWVKGTAKSYGHLQDKILDRPADAIETWEEHLTQSSMYSETFSSVQVLWESPTHSSAVREEIRGRFPKPFDGSSPPPLARFPRKTRSGV